MLNLLERICTPKHFYSSSTHASILSSTPACRQLGSSMLHVIPWRGSCKCTSRGEGELQKGKAVQVAGEMVQPSSPSAKMPPC